MGLNGFFGLGDFGEKVLSALTFPSRALTLAKFNFTKLNGNLSGHSDRYEDLHQIPISLVVNKSEKTDSELRPIFLNFIKKSFENNNFIPDSDFSLDQFLQINLRTTIKVL